METKTPKRDKRTYRRGRGRPPKPVAEKLDVVVAVRLNAEQISLLDIFCERHSLPRASATRMLLMRALDRYIDAEL